MGEGTGPLFLSHPEGAHARSGMSPEVGGFNDEVVVVALQVAVLPAENVQHLHHQEQSERESRRLLLLLLLLIQP